MAEDRIDPVRYAWERCNRGVSLPDVLVKGVGPSPFVSASTSGRTTAVSHTAFGEATVRAALHAFAGGAYRRSRR